MRVSGVIRDGSSNKAVSRARIVLTVSQSQLAELVSDRDGRFEYRDEASRAGEVLLCKIDKKGYKANETSTRIEGDVVDLDLRVTPIPVDEDSTDRRRKRRGIRILVGIGIPVIAAIVAALVLAGLKPEILEFSPSEKRVLAGDPVTLSWSTKNAARVLLDGNPVHSESRVVNPVVTTTYHLTAANWLGKDEQETTVEVLSSTNSIELLLERLKDENARTRIETLKRLADIRPPAARAVPAIQSLLKTDKDAQVRKESVAALARIEPAAEESIGAFVSALSDPDQDVGGASVRALAAAGEAAVEPMIARIGDGDVNIREAAHQVLVEIGEEAIEPLCNALDREEVRLAAARLLVKLGGQCKPLAAVLTNMLGNEKSRTEAMELLVRLKGEAVEELIHALRNQNDDIRGAAKQVLIRIDLPAVKPLEEVLVEYPLGVQAAMVLLKLGRDTKGAVDTILTQLERFSLDREKVRIVTECVEALAAVPEPDLSEIVIPSLIERMKAKPISFHSGALGMIGRTSPKKVVTLLIPLLRSEGKERFFASAIISRIGAEAVPYLMSRLGIKDWKEVVSDVLRDMGKPAADALEAILRDGSSSLSRRASAAAILADMYQFRSSREVQWDDSRRQLILGTSIQMLQRGDSETKTVGIQLLNRLAPPLKERELPTAALKEMLRSSRGSADFKSIDRLLQKVVRVSPETRASYLIEALKNPTTALRHEAVFELGKLGRAARAAIPELRRLANSDREIIIRSEAQKALKKIGG